jgi:hypothetical protein
MTESFDDFAQKRDEELQNRKRLAEETKPEWEILKSETAKFAQDGKGIDGHKFGWEPNPTARGTLLVLSDVSANLFDRGERDGVPQDCGVFFSRKPAGPGRMYFDDSPVATKTWSLEPKILAGRFVWFVSERKCHLSTAELADEIAKELAQYHIEYEKAYGRAG